MTEKEIGKTSTAINANETIWNFFANRKTPGEKDQQK